MPVNGKALVTLVGGGILLYTGLTDPAGNPRSLLKSLLKGSKPVSPSATGSALLPAGTGTGAAGTGSGTATGTGTADGPTVVVDGIPVAPWFAPLIAYARAHGWTGTLTSGYRSAADQARVCATGVQPCAHPGTSHHQGTGYPDGAIDVTPAGVAPAAFVLVVRSSGLQGAQQVQAAGAKDPVHISIPGVHRSGEGSY